MKDIIEEKYDNIDIHIDNEKGKYSGDSSLLDSYINDIPLKGELNNMEDRNIEGNMVKDNIENKDEPLFSNILNNKGINEIKSVGEKNIQPIIEDEPQRIPEPELALEKEGHEENGKELISISKDQDIDAETVDLFYEDVSKLMEKRGMDINKNINTYTLFDDAEN